MTTPSAPDAAKKTLLSRIAATQRQADHAKKSAKLAKLGLRNAKTKFKDAKRAAKKLRKTVKALKAELTAVSLKKPAPRAARKVAAKRVRPVKVTAPAVAAEVPLIPAVDLPPVLPAQ